MTTVQHLIGSHIWVKRTPEWNAVLETLSLPMFRDHERSELMNWVDLRRRTIDWGQLHSIANQYSEEKRTLLRVAHALYNGGDCQLSELATLSNAARSAAILIIGLRYR